MWIDEIHMCCHCNQNPKLFAWYLLWPFSSAVYVARHINGLNKQSRVQEIPLFSRKHKHISQHNIQACKYINMSHISPTKIGIRII